MGATMRVNTDTLRDVSRKLKTVHSTFSNAEELSKDWRGAVGHDGLADVLDDFSGNWDDTRENMLESIKGLGEAAEGIAQVFEDTEDELTTALEESGEAPPPPGVNPGMV